MVRQTVTVMKLKEQLLDSIIGYFHVLKRTGYLKEKETFGLLYFMFIQEFLEKNVGFVTEDDYNKIMNSINVITGQSCLIPYRFYKQHIDPMNMNLGRMYKSQFGKAKSTEDYKLRSVLF